jgi:hypothetical protein
MNRLIILLSLLLLWPACLKEEQHTSSEALFQEMWETFDRQYAYFELRGVDWQAVYDQYKPRASKASPEELRGLLCEMIATLEDGHVNLYSPEGSCGYDFTKGAPVNSPVHAIDYTVDYTELNEALHYARLKDKPIIGYLRISSFSGERGLFRAIDQVLEELQGAEALIIDLRDNGGGSDANSEVIASRFATRTTHYRRFRYRNGPEHDDFTPWIDDYITPAGPIRYDKPVVLLTNRRCFSTTEDFVLAMKAFDGVQTVGDTTGGGFGNPIFRELSNGWVYRLSHWQMQTADGQQLEGIGVAPDYLQAISRADSLAGRDAILERAIEVLD